MGGLRSGLAVGTSRQPSCREHSVEIWGMDLVRDPIPRLIRQIAVPASVGFFFNTMYNIVDTFFAGLDSTDALAALAASFPIFFIILAMGWGVGQGATALIANAAGEGDPAAAHHFTLQSMSFGLLLSVVLTVLGLWSAPFLFRSLGAEERFLELSLEYMNWILLGTVFFLMQSILNATLNALGDTRTFRDVLIAGCLLNVVLDPWLMFGGWGVPPLGIRGIALATVLIQVAGCGYLLYRARLALGLGSARSARLPGVGGARIPGEFEHADRGFGHLRDHLVYRTVQQGGGGGLWNRDAYRADLPPADDLVEHRDPIADWPEQRGEAV